MSEIKEKQLRYWNELLDHARRSGKEVVRVRGPHKSTANELHFYIGGGTGVELRTSMDRRNGSIKVSLYLTRARKHGIYQRLLGRRREIDSALGHEASEWIRPGEPSWRSSGGHIARIEKYVDPMDEFDWPEQHRWLADTLKQYDQVFRPIVKQL